MHQGMGYQPACVSPTTSRKTAVSHRHFLDLCLFLNLAGVAANQSILEAHAPQSTWQCHTPPAATESLEHLGAMVARFDGIVV
ncbi:hypothetical protein GUJ93_ZPchr0008g13640 [Zizania palustris]|uniref:Uncharacterized protein n=1 Tax=Zizania palustris TaxID=103762 RepID=A0A8J5RHM2_ZIZPA|nr:hypothetical protein GUJ93_ZPchr0008g13640 [Zizania palustris]